MDLALAYLLRGERVGIREPSPADREAYFDLRRASEDFHRSWEPTPHLDVDPYSSASFEAFLADEGELPRRVRLFVCRRSDDALLGLVNINEIVRGCSGRLTFVIRKNESSPFRNESNEIPSGMCRVPITQPVGVYIRTVAAEWLMGSALYIPEVGGTLRTEVLPNCRWPSTGHCQTDILRSLIEVR